MVYQVGKYSVSYSKFHGSGSDSTYLYLLFILVLYLLLPYTYLYLTFRPALYLATVVFTLAGAHGGGAASNSFFPSLGNHDWGESEGKPNNIDAHREFFPALASRRRDCHVADTPSPSLLKHLHVL